jgi:hypothetical protein
MSSLVDEHHKSADIHCQETIGALVPTYDLKRS